MPTYIVLMNYTDKGIQTIKKSPARLSASKEAARALGCEVKAFYLTMGTYDIIEIVDARDDESMAKLLLMQGTGGNIRTTTMRAFTEAEFNSAVRALP